jgi:hypothetical protein
MVAGGSVTATERRQKTREGIRSLVRLKSDDNRAQVDRDGPTSANRSIHAGQSNPDLRDNSLFPASDSGRSC